MNVKYLLSIFSILTVCNYSNGQTDLKFERKVFYEVVPKIIDSQFPKWQGVFKIKKTLGDNISIWTEETSVNAIIGIMDSVYGFNNSFYNKYINLYFSDTELKFDTLKIGNNYRLDILKIKKREDYNYKYLSEVPGPEKRWNRSKDFYLLGLIGFSRILFDEKKKFGIMDFSATCGQQCGLTALVYLKNENGNWVIDEIESILID
ncbi:hypothetical protein [Flagellimonas meridianipacifica]|uniref:Uncharacterized protein n=1 Tax=Flagellimonas meridianipacifica TaxID=1080225 RepID=A0A2T0MGF4_9FLAO|nr:hypothetical protein [Allomuricauda pacifica]PRX56660.1 hypothetical protein CLV81_0657 [Allomuricauda pacifica]